MSAQAMRLLRESRRKAGLCTRCGLRKVNNGTTCEDCRAESAYRRTRLEDAGLCPRCAVRPLAPGHYRCADCLAADKARRERAA